MWQTVASSGESDGNSGSSSEGSGNEDSEGDGRRVDMKEVGAMSKRKKVEKEKEGRSKTDEREGERATKRRKREKKEKKRKHEERERKRRRKEEKDDRKKEKRRKKDGKKEEKKKKKKKKERRDDKAKGAIIPGAVDMNQFGKHGIIRVSGEGREKGGERGGNGRQGMNAQQVYLLFVLIVSRMSYLLLSYLLLLNCRNRTFTGRRTTSKCGVRRLKVFPKFPETTTRPSACFATTWR